MRHFLLKGKLIPLLTFFICTSANLLQAQVGSNNFNYNFPKPLGATWLDVSFYDNNNGIAVGASSTIAKTTDAGVTWKYGVVMVNTITGLKQRPTLQDVQFVTPSVAYACGDSGTLIKSIDGGLNWTQLSNPLYANNRSVNAVWFINKDTGYIGGQAHNLAPTSADSLNPLCSPKLYFTRNGGTTWDSINAPRGALSWVGLIQNTVNPPIKVPTNALNKEIYRIQFVNDSVGYVIGSGSGTTGGFPQAYPGTTAGSTTTSTFAANIGSLVWKVNKNVITDYTVTKEKLGYSGVAQFGTPPTATTTYNALTIPQQSLKAMIPLSDSVLIVQTFNNGIVLRIKTGVNDSTVLSQFNAATLPGAMPAVTGGLTGLPTAKGKIEIVQFNPANAPSTPVAYNQMPLPILPTYSILNSNCVNGKKGPDGKWWFTTSGGKLGMSPDNGVTWSLIQAVPTGNIGAGLQMFALDITPNGKLHEMGTNGIHATSTDAGATWSSNYTAPTLSPGLNKMEWADCNNGVIVGANGLVVTTNNGGQSWTDKTITSLAASFVSMFGISFPAPNRLYFPASNGSVFFSPDMGTTNNLIFSPAISSTNYGMATFGSGATTSIWVTSYRSSAPLAERVVVYRSLNNGISWDTIKQFSAMTPTTSLINISQVIKFVDANTGYMCGPKGHVYKTTNGGTTWTAISPDIPLTTNTGFSGQHSLGVFGNKLIYWTLVSTTRYMYISSDGGATWTPNIFPITIANEPVTNIADFVMHDANNFIALTGPNKILITNDGGTTWRFEEAPSGSAFTAGQFVPPVVPAGTPMSNRKLYISGNQVLEYGASNLINVSSSETITQPTCSNTTGGSITINPNGSVAPYTYSINGGAFQSLNTFTGLAAGNYTIRVKTSACDSVVKVINVPFNDNLTLTASNDTSVCAGAPVPLLATATTGSTYAWTPATGLSSASVNNPTAIVNSNTAYTVTASLNGCTRNKIINITIKPNPIVNAGPDRTIVNGDVIQLAGVGSAAIQSVLWTPVTGITLGGNTYTPTVAPTTTTTYTMTVKDNNNCTSTDNAVVTVIPYCVKVMDAFTPNGDGINDKWLTTNGAACTNQIIVTVFNRYGGLVYENKNYQNNWDGTYKGKAIPDGTYYYVVTYNLINNRSYTLKGDVTILR